MSTAPSGWQDPKLAWQSSDVPLPTDFERIEGNAYAAELGSRTLDPAQVPSSNTGHLRQILDWLANRIRAITGTANWYDTPATTLAATKSHMDATSGVHGATSSATANRIIIRDSAGRAKVAAPSASNDIARKAEVDAVSSALNTHKSSANHDGRYYRKNEWARSAGGAGYVKLPNGIILQWGLSPSVAGNDNTSATFPIAFPTDCLRVIAVKQNSTTSDDNNWAVVRGFSKTQADFRMEASTSVETGTRYVAYLAIGY